MVPVSSCGDTNGVFVWLRVVRRATAGTCFALEVFFCGIADRRRGVIVLAWEEAAVEIDRRYGFNGVIVAAAAAAAPAMDAAAPSAERALAALSSRKCSFRTCLEAFRFLIKALEKGDIVLGGRGRSEREVRFPIAMLCGLLSPMILM